MMRPEYGYAMKDCKVSMHLHPSKASSSLCLHLCHLRRAHLDMARCQHPGIWKAAIAIQSSYISPWVTLHARVA